MNHPLRADPALQAAPDRGWSSPSPGTNSPLVLFVSGLSPSKGATPLGRRSQTLGVGLMQLFHASRVARSAVEN